MEISLKDLLSCRFFSTARVLAGEGGLSNLVTSVTVLDSPDAAKYIKGGELVVTTAYSLLNNERAQKEVIVELAKNGAAGLGLKLRFFQHQLPKVMEETAQELNFPIIAISDEYAYTDIYEFVKSHLISRVTGEVKREDEVFKEINESTYKEGLMGVVKTLYKWTGLQSLILYGNQFLIYPPGEAAEEIPMNPDKWHKKAVNVNFAQGVSYYYWEKAGVSYLWLGKPLFENGREQGYVMLLKGNRDFVRDDYLMLEGAASACIVELKRLKSLVNLRRKYRRNFLENLLKGKYAWDEASYHAQELDFHLPEEGMVVLVKFVPPIIDLFQEGDITEVENIIVNILGKRVLFGLLEKDKMVICLPHQPEKYLPLIEKMYQQLSEALTAAKIIIGIGRAAEFYDLKKSYEEALNAITIGSCLNFTPQIYHFSKLGFYRLLKLPEMEQEMIRYYEDYLKPLEIHDRQDLELLKTLECFIESNYSYRVTAERMFIHPNTVRYRISLIEKKCRVNFKYAYDRLNMEIALKILPLILSAAKK